MPRKRRIWEQGRCYHIMFGRTVFTWLETDRNTEATEKPMENNQLTQAIIGAAIEVHKRLGPGLLDHEEKLVDGVHRVINGY